MPDRFRGRIYLIGIIGGLLASTVYANEAIFGRLLKMSDAIETRNYHGRLVYMHDGVFDTIEIFHRNQQGQISERLVALNGPIRELVREDNQYTCYLPKRKSDLAWLNEFKNPIPVVKAEHKDVILQSYLIDERPGRRINNMKTWEIQLQPKDKDRFQHTFWLSQKNNFLLGYELSRLTGETLEVLEFVDLAIGLPLADKQFEPTFEKGQSWIWNKNMPALDETVDSQWRVEWLPKGFMLSLQTERKSPITHSMVEHWMLTDGLAKVSLFFEPIKVSESFQSGMMQKGATVAYGRLINKHIVTVVGEIPQSTAEKITHSVKRQ